MRIEGSVTATVQIPQALENKISKSQNVKKIQNNQDFESTFNNNEKKKVEEEQIISAIEKANKEFMIYDRKFEFSIHEKTKAIMVKVIDAKNDEIIREIPPEKILDMVAKLWELAGIMVDEKI